MKESQCLKGKANFIAINNPQHDEQQRSLSSSLASFKPVAITINTFFKQESEKLSDEDLFRCLSDLKKPTSLIKKLKCLPGYLKLEFSPFNFDFSSTPTSNNSSSSNSSSLNNHFVLSPELQFLKLLNSTSPHQQTHQMYQQSLLSHHHHLTPIKDVLEFPSHNVYEPNSFYRNLLYIYPLSINICSANVNRSSMMAGGGSGSGGMSASGQAPNSALSNNSSLLNSSSARNIAIKVNFMKGEEEHCALPVLFAKSSSTLEYCKEVFVNVVYHNKAPQYHDEVKIKLPALLADNNYHLLFTFYHISCQSSKDQNQLETIIGYSWLPLQQQFQYETTIHFANPSNNLNISQMNANNVYTSGNFVSNSQMNQANFDLNNASFQINSNDLNLNGSTTTTTTNRCSMIKSGIYSLPISFEKLPTGYANLNYSIYDNSLNSTQSNVNTNNCTNK